MEGEIGHVGEAVKGDNAVSDRYTTVKEAMDFLDATGADALAVAIGTAHGAYKEKPCLDLQRLREISAAVDASLVLHGGSGLSDDDFRNVVRDGIAKINIFTDLCVAGAISSSGFDLFGSFLSKVTCPFDPYCGLCI